jgi:hypothetical protein
VRGQATLCPSCNRKTRTVYGLCPNCGNGKEGGSRIPPRRIPASDFWGDLDDAVFLSLWLVPGLALVIVALLFVASDLLLLAGLALLVGPLVMKLLHDR